MQDNDQEKLLIFKRPCSSPAFIENAYNIRINYKSYWIDFRNGKVVVTEIKEGAPK